MRRPWNWPVRPVGLRRRSQRPALAGGDPGRSGRDGTAGRHVPGDGGPGQGDRPPGWRQIPAARRDQRVAPAGGRGRARGRGRGGAADCHHRRGVRAVPHVGHVPGHQPSGAAAVARPVGRGRRGHRAGEGTLAAPADPGLTGDQGPASSRWPAATSPRRRRARPPRAGSSAPPGSRISISFRWPSWRSTPPSPAATRPRPSGSPRKRSASTGCRAALPATDGRCWCRRPGPACWRCGGRAATATGRCGRTPRRCCPASRRSARSSVRTARYRMAGGGRSPRWYGRRSRPWMTRAARAAPASGVTGVTRRARRAPGTRRAGSAAAPTPVCRVG